MNPIPRPESRIHLSPPMREDTNVLASLQASNRQLRAALTQAENAAKDKDLFLASMSHEIRTQLNGMVGIVELMLNDATMPPEQRTSLTTMKRSSATLQRILNDILDYTQLCAYEVAIEAKTFSPPIVVKEVIEAFRSNAQAKGLSLFSMISESVPDSVVGDETRLRQVLSNIVGNAIKFTEEGRVGVFVSSEGTAPEEAEELHFEVMDTGMGMSEDQIERLFQPFGQANASISRKYGGSGLGLLICKNLIERMGGSIQVESEEGHGSAFQFQIAAITKESVAPSEKISIYPRDANVANKVTTKGKALLAEDNDVNQFVGKMTLERLGYEVDVASDGKQAIQAAQANDYDLICMDVTMPDIDGLEATRRIRNLQKPSSEATIIAMTGHAFSEDRKRCLSAGMDGFLSKPFELAQLKDILENTSHPKPPEPQVA